MTELKPCRLCGAAPRWEDLNGATCPTADCPQNTVWGWWEESWNKWNASPEPKLPEGYKVQGTDLVCERLPHDLALIAFIRAGELVCSNIKREHWQAVAAFLQGAR